MRAWWKVLAATGALLVVTAGCGDSPGRKPVDSAASSGKPKATATASAGSGDMVAFAKCMREHGVDMADPQPGRVGEVGPGSNQETTAKAQKACQKFLPSIDLNAKPDPNVQEQMLKYAKCMRDNGIDFPDPAFDPNGGISTGQGAGVNADDPKVQAALKQCDKIITGKPGGTP